MKVSGIDRAMRDLKTQVNAAVTSNKEKVLNRLVDRLAEATPVDTGRARDGWRREGDSIVNDVEYIDQLNHGSSKQAPAFFIERTVLSEPGVTPKGSVVEYVKSS